MQIDALISVGSVSGASLAIGVIGMMQIDGILSGGSLTGAALVIGAIGTIIGQILTNSKLNAEREERRRDAATLLEQTKAEASLLAEKAKHSNEKLTDLVKENSVMTKDGTKAAQDAYQEANGFNKWRSEMDDRMKRLDVSIESLLIQKQGASSPAADPTTVIDTRLVEVSKQVAQEIKTAANPEKEK